MRVLPSQVLHLLFTAIADFRSSHGGAHPTAADAAEFQGVVDKRNTDKMEVDARLQSEVLRCCSAVLSPIAAIFGGIAGQEVIKAW